MKVNVNLKTTTETLREASVSVANTDNGDVCVVIKVDGGETRRCFVSTKHAVMMWRCLTRETESCMFEYRTVPEKNAVPEKIAVTYDDKGAVWNIEMRNAQFLVNADQALALAWGIQQCIMANTVIEAPEAASKPLTATRHISLKEVWLLTSRLVLKGGGSENICGKTLAFSSKGIADDKLREFLRELVNYSDDPCETESDIDNILDKIIENEVITLTEGKTLYMCKYDGKRASFTVTIRCVGVDSVC